MKYYTYISDAKINMLYDQLSSTEQNKKEASLGFDLKLIKGDIKDTYNKPITKYKKLDTIIKNLNKSKQIGTIDRPKSFIKGDLELRVNMFTQNNAVFWTGIYEVTQLGLIGSKHHVIGNLRQSEAGENGCHYFLDWIDEAFNSDVRNKLLINNDLQPYYSKDLFSKGRGIHAVHSFDYYIWRINEFCIGNKFNFEFIAKVLHYNEDLKNNFLNDYKIQSSILATPLYMALNEIYT